MVDHSDMPSALQVAQAVSAVLGEKLADQSASEIVLTREEAALCHGLPRASPRTWHKASRTPAERTVPGCP